MTIRPPIKLRRAGAALALSSVLALAHAPSASASAPDLAFETPIAKGGPQAQTAVSGAKLRSGLARYLRRSWGQRRCLGG